LPKKHPFDTIATDCRKKESERKKASVNQQKGIPRGFEVVGWAGLEPTTNALKGHCSTN
jgi:hypothetical protein